MGTCQLPPASGGDEVRVTDAASGVVGADGIKFVDSTSTEPPDFEFHTFVMRVTFPLAVMRCQVPGGV